MPGFGVCPFSVVFAVVDVQRAVSFDAATFASVLTGA